MFSIRYQLIDAMHEAGKTVTDLARELGVSKSAVSRHLSSEEDMKVSTAVALAAALGRKWETPKLVE